jgi:hypothetical protein
MFPSRPLAGAALFTAWLLAAAVPADGQGPTGSDTFNVNTCQTPERDSRSCGPVRWGWGSCPGNPKAACDWCYGPDGVFAYVKRTHKTYKLASKCEQLAELPPDEVFWSVSDPDVVDRMESAGGTCVPEGEIYICQGVDPEVYRRTAKAPGRGGPIVPRKQETGDLPADSPCEPSGGTRALADYDVIPIQRLELRDGLEFRRDPGRFARNYEALTNGTFFGSPAKGAPVEPVGPIVIGGQQRLRKDGKPIGFTPAGRGGIAVFKGKDGDVVRVVRQPGRTLPEIRNAFPGVDEFMGGGALLIEDGRAVGTEDLLERQRFTNPSRTGDPPRGTNQGLHAGQMNSAFHTLVGVRNGKAFLLIPRSPKTGSRIQRDLCEQGFQDVVMFDGGHGFAYYRNGKEQKGTYHGLPGLTGLGVNPR